MSREGYTVFLDTAPIIYFVERHRKYHPYLLPFFMTVDMGRAGIVTTPVALAECLVHPYRDNNPELAQQFINAIVNGHNTSFILPDREIACKAAQLRAKYNLELSDALQVATCITARCALFLTNDKNLKRVQEIEVLTMGDIVESDPDYAEHPLRRGLAFWFRLNYGRNE